MVLIYRKVYQYIVKIVKNKVFENIDIVKVRKVDNCYLFRFIIELGELKRLFRGYGIIIFQYLCIVKLFFFI